MLQQAMLQRWPISCALAMPRRSGLTRISLKLAMPSSRMWSRPRRHATPRKWNRPRALVMKSLPRWATWRVTRCLRQPRRQVHLLGRAWLWVVRVQQQVRWAWWARRPRALAWLLVRVLAWPLPVAMLLARPMSCRAKVVPRMSRRWMPPVGPV